MLRNAFASGKELNQRSEENVTCNTGSTFCFRIGRRRAFYLAMVVLFGSSCGLVAMTEYVGFCILLFLIGGACLGLYLCSYVISKYNKYILLD